MQEEYTKHEHVVRKCLNGAGNTHMGKIYSIRFRQRAPRGCFFGGIGPTPTFKSCPWSDTGASSIVFKYTAAWVCH